MEQLTVWVPTAIVRMWVALHLLQLVADVHLVQPAIQGWHALLASPQ